VNYYLIQELDNIYYSNIRKYKSQLALLYKKHGTPT
jgi:hypothetical protein